MKILTPQLGVKGIVTLEVHNKEGDLVHEEKQDNLVTNQGLAGINGVELGNELLNTCILGRSGVAASAADGFFSGAFITGITTAVCNQEFAGDSYCPIPQSRSIVARSTNNGGTVDVYSHDAVNKYWSLIRKRIFTYSKDYFLAAADGVTADSCMEGNQFSDWVAEGWGDLPTEASYIKELGFGSGTFQVIKPTQACPPVHPADFFKPMWANNSDLTGLLWNRVVLNQSIGWPAPYAWGAPDVELGDGAVITVTLELRLYYSTDTITQNLTIDGNPTTVRTRVQSITNANVWAEGALRYLGNWRGKARIGESNSLPPTNQGYFPDGGSAAIDTYFVSSAGGVYTRGHRADASEGNWAGGIGGLTHANFTTDNERQLFCTTFNPKISKSDLEKCEFEISYTWSER